MRNLYSPRKILRVWYGDAPLQPFNSLRSAHFCGLVAQRRPELYGVIFTDENDPGGITFTDSLEHLRAERDVMNGISKMFQPGVMEAAETFEMTLDPVGCFI
jgi:hypothetical protein